MIRKKPDEEYAIILLDARSVCCLRGVRFCPGNSAFSIYSVGYILSCLGPTAFDNCFPNPDTYQAGFSEIFVPDSVPISLFREIIIANAGSSQYWRQKIVDAYNAASEPWPLPAEPIMMQGPTERFYFPGDYRPKRTEFP
jgi:hypothetical protein